MLFKDAINVEEVRAAGTQKRLTGCPDEADHAPHAQFRPRRGASCRVCFPGPLTDTACMAAPEPGTGPHPPTAVRVRALRVPPQLVSHTAANAALWADLARLRLFRASS